MQVRIDLLGSYVALIALLEEHACSLSIQIADLRADGEEALASVLAEVERGHHARIRQLRSEAMALMGDGGPLDGDA